MINNYNQDKWIQKRIIKPIGSGIGYSGKLLKTSTALNSAFLYRIPQKTKEGINLNSANSSQDSSSEILISTHLNNPDNFFPAGTSSIIDESPESHTLNELNMLYESEKALGAEFEYKSSGDDLQLQPHMNDDAVAHPRFVSSPYTPKEESAQFKNLPPVPPNVLEAIKQFASPSKPTLEPKPNANPQDEILRFQNGLGIGLLPDNPSKTEIQNHADKQKFMNDLINQEAAKQNVPLLKMNNLAAQSPLFNAGMKNLADNLEKWDQLAQNPAELKKLQDRIVIQYQNLSALTVILYQVSNNSPENAQNIPLIGMDAKMKKALLPYLAGQYRIGHHERIQIYTQVNDALNMVSRPTPHNSFIIPEEMDIVIKQARLFEAERTGKAFAADQKVLSTLGTSVNEVTKMSGPLVNNFTQEEAIKAAESAKDEIWLLSKPPNESGIWLTTKTQGIVEKSFYTENPAKPGIIISARGNEFTYDGLITMMKNLDYTHLYEDVAYFKRGKGGEMASGIMEKMIWDMAVVMGAGSQFAATKQTTIRTKSEMVGGKKSGNILRPNGEIEKVDGMKQAIEGGIQAGQSGALLSKVIQEPDFHPDIPRESVIEGALTTMVFGMWDAHAKNIIVDMEGKIKFFDNTRSMPHSNSFINRGGVLASSYRSGLLTLPVSYEKLTSAEMNKIMKDLLVYENKIKDLRNFLNNPQTQAQINGLPPGWFNSAEAMSALEERVANLKRVLTFHLKSGEPLSLRDLSVEFNPAFKFNAALLMVDAIYNKNPPPTCFDLSLGSINKLQRSTLSSVGYRKLDIVFENCLNRGISPVYIRQLCNDPELNFDEIVHAIGKKIAENAIQPDPTIRNERIKSARLLDQLKQNAKIDFKDYERSRIPQLSFNLLTQDVQRAGLRTDYFSKFANAKQYYSKELQTNQLGFCKDVSDPAQCKVYHRDRQNQLIEYDVDYLSVPNKVIIRKSEGGVEMPAMSVSEMKEFLTTQRLASNQVLGDYVKMVSNVCKNAGVPLEVMSNRQAAQAAKNLAPGKILIAQRHASNPPQFKMYRKTAEGKIEHFNLAVVNRVEYNGKFALKKTDGQLSPPIDLNNLFKLPPRKKWS